MRHVSRRHEETFARKKDELFMVNAASNLEAKAPCRRQFSGNSYRVVRRLDETLWPAGEFDQRNAVSVLMLSVT